MDVYNNDYIYNNGHYNVQPPQYQVYRHTVTEWFCHFCGVCMWGRGGFMYLIVRRKLYLKNKQKKHWKIIKNANKLKKESTSR